MTQHEAAILETIKELETAVKAMSTSSPKPNLFPLFEKLDSLARALPRDSDPELRHFLQRKSYEKARCLLEGKSGHITPGRCE